MTTRPAFPSSRNRTKTTREENAAAIAYAAKQNSDRIAAALRGAESPDLPPEPPEPTPYEIAAQRALQALEDREVSEQRRDTFVREYIRTGFNAVEAAKRAGFPRPHIDGPNFVKRRDMKDLVRNLEVMGVEAADLTVERIKHEIVRIVSCDPVEFFNEDGSPKQLHELTKDQRAAIATIEKGAYGFKYKLHDKMKAMNLAASVLGMNQIKIEHTGGIEHRINFDALDPASLDAILGILPTSESDPVARAKPVGILVESTDAVDPVD
jgi:phage terminase small subunit